MKVMTRSVKRPGPARNDGARYARNIQTAALKATDRASKLAQGGIQRKMRAVGLGRLSNAVGQTSAWKKRQFDRNPYGVIYARGGDESLAGGALEAYSQGTTITGKGGGWLAFASEHMPRKVGRRRLTPALYNSSGLAARFGKLHFVPGKANFARLVIRGGTLSGKGRIREPAKRGGRGIVKQKEVTAFILIKSTKREKRFDKDEEVAIYAAMVPAFIAEEMQRLS